jgi:hypothetical protein
MSSNITIAINCNKVEKFMFQMQYTHKNAYIQGGMSMGQSQGAGNYYGYMNYMHP